jgi:hypothetical protein
MSNTSFSPEYIEQLRQAKELLKGVLPLVQHSTGCNPYSNLGLDRCSCGASKLVPAARALIAKIEKKQPEIITKAEYDKETVKPLKTPEFTPISVTRVPHYSAGPIVKAYMLRDGCIVGYCEVTREWLKWNTKNQLHSSLGRTRSAAAALEGDHWHDTAEVGNE